MPELPPIYLPDPKDLALLHQQAQIEQLEGRLAELEQASVASAGQV